jgi:hypothetical protein
MAEQQPAPRLVPSREAARYIAMSESWLRKTRVNGGTDGPPFYREGGAIRYQVADLDAWLAQRRCGGSAPKNQPEPQPAEPKPPARRSRGIGHQRKPPRRSGKGGRGRPLR